MKYVDVSFEDGPLLVMEHLPPVTLGRQNAHQRLNPEEVATVLFQTLQALDYLQTLQLPVIHRGIWRHNILVASRHPRLCCKLAGFSNAKEGATAEGFVGTSTRAAPELVPEHKYGP